MFLNLGATVNFRHCSSEIRTVRKLGGLEDPLNGFSIHLAEARDRHKHACRSQKTKKKKKKKKNLFNGNNS